MDTWRVSTLEQPADPGAVRLQLLDVLGGFLRTQALHTVAVLGVADIVGNAPVTVEELAAQVQANPSSLHRVLRLLASNGVFCQGSREFPTCDDGNSPPCGRPVRAGRSAAMASRWRRMR